MVRVVRCRAGSIEERAEMLAVSERNTVDELHGVHSALRFGLALFGVAAFLIGCSQSSADADHLASGGAGGRTSTEPEQHEPGLGGVLTDESGEVLGNNSVLACMANVCLFGRSDADGRFLFAIDPPASVALKTPEDLSVTPRRGALLKPIRLTTVAADVGAVRVPSLPEGVPISPSSTESTTYDLGDELSLTLAPADLTPRLGDTLRDVAARRIPLEQIGALPGLEGEQVVAVYAIHPFAATSRSPIAVRAALQLPNGTAVKFRSISEIDGRLSEPALGVSDGDTVRTSSGNGIAELTWLVISR